MADTKNPLETWRNEHFRKIVRELREKGIEIKAENVDLILHETSFRVRSERMKGKNECPYYDSGKSCHDSVFSLNCLLCACPNYLFHSLQGGCGIGSENGRFIEHPNLPEGRVWDCSNCSYGHSYEEAKNWLIKNIDFLSKC